MIRRLVVLFAVLGSAPAISRAGVSPENVIVVVNADSNVSRTIANYYVELRNIPSSNVILLSDIPTGLIISLEDFKSKILQPVLNQLNARSIAAQARVIAYSADFPTSVNIAPHCDRLTDPVLKKYQLPTASLNGLTYLYQFILADSEKYLDWGANLYSRGPFERHFVNPYLDDRRERFENAVKLLDEAEFAKGAEELEKLFEESPTLSPLAIRAAEARMRADDGEAAKRLIEQAVAAGWSSRTYLDENETLAAVMAEPQMKSLRARLSDLPTVAQEQIGFRSDVSWTLCGHPTANLKDGIPYLMSCMLAVVHPLGSDVPQATSVLQRASRSDSTFPDGVFWFTKTDDVRTKTRFPGIPNALLWLAHLDRRAEVIHNPMPDQAGDCAGLMLGTAVMAMSDTKWKFVPGAISENLTSLSAHFGTPGQTKITDLLHAGAAISSGPVQEPYSLPFKFPQPMMYGYYASGVTAIEAFYLSVASPYQLLIVGDPLAQPFARPPSDWVGVTVQSEDRGQRPVRVSRRPIATPKNRHSNVRAIELFIEGRLIRQVPAAANIEMNLPGEWMGLVELRTVLIGNDLADPRKSHVEWIEFEGDSTPPVASVRQDPNSIWLECPGAESIDLMHHAELIGSVSGEAGEIRIEPNSLGEGPVRLRPIARFGDAKVSGRPLVLEGS